VNLLQPFNPSELTYLNGHVVQSLQAWHNEEGTNKDKDFYFKDFFWFEGFL
jgi:hypothetical protein